MLNNRTFFEVEVSGIIGQAGTSFSKTNRTPKNLCRTHQSGCLAVLGGPAKLVICVILYNSMGAADRDQQLFSITVQVDMGI